VRLGIGTEPYWQRERQLHPDENTNRDGTDDHERHDEPEHDHERADNDHERERAGDDHDHCQYDNASGYAIHDADHDSASEVDHDGAGRDRRRVDVNDVDLDNRHLAHPHDDRHQDRVGDDLHHADGNSHDDRAGHDDDHDVDDDRDLHDRDGSPGCRRSRGGRRVEAGELGLERSTGVGMGADRRRRGRPGNRRGGLVPPAERAPAYGASGVTATATTRLTARAAS
jgi:hypothetical protein